MSGHEPGDNDKETTGSCGLTLIVVCGLPGSGKTTVAETAAERITANLLRTDVVRKELFPDPDYTDQEERAVYSTLFDRARQSLDSESPTVLDGTFHRENHRDQAREVGVTRQATVRMLKVECPESVVRERIETRTDDASDADFEIHRLFRESFDSVSDDCIIIDNSGSIETTHRQLEESLPEWPAE